MNRGGGPLALTMGDPAGIGGELTLKAWLGRTADTGCFFVLDDPARLTALAHRLGWPVPIAVIDGPQEAVAAFDDALPVLPIQLPFASIPGRADPRNAPAVIGSIETAVRLVESGMASGVVTNPISKSVLYAAGFPFPGHTEYLADLAGGKAVPVMMLAGPSLRVVPVTVHLALAAALRSLDQPTIITAAQITIAALCQDFGIARPRLAIAGVNPHAGESGAMGSEERDIIAPAVAALRGEGIDAIGPLPPDTLFTPTARAGYDAALCMYHDQALIPIKALDFDRAVNVTLGLPFVRTSPDHGTAFDIAGSGRANATSLIAAIHMARAIAGRRAGATAAT
ncbi:MAG: 4-hydroxythreonine-4-phosphate dehydrogenase PdxA [Rhodospirillales bacterium]